MCLAFIAFLKGHWTRITEPVGGRLSYKPPVQDINAPDLYIPLMAFGTYIVVAGYALGVLGRFIRFTRNTSWVYLELQKTILLAAQTGKQINIWTTALYMIWWFILGLLLCDAGLPLKRWPYSSLKGYLVGFCKLSSSKVCCTPWATVRHRCWISWRMLDMVSLVLPSQCWPASSGVTCTTLSCHGSASARESSLWRPWRGFFWVGQGAMRGTLAGTTTSYSSWQLCSSLCCSGSAGSAADLWSYGQGTRIIFERLLSRIDLWHFLLADESWAIVEMVQNC